jgi:hypothetical protein
MRHAIKLGVLDHHLVVLVLPAPVRSATMASVR